LNEKHEPVLKWRVRNAFPTKVIATVLKADGNEVAVESIEIQHEGLVIE
jgi:phage tail-like protein